MVQTNFLIGRGELLAYDIPSPGGGGGKADAYTLQEAKDRLLPQAVELTNGIDKLPSDSCPNDIAVARLTLNPSYIAKSFFPSSLLGFAEFRSIGSRTVSVKPCKWTKAKKPTTCSTTEIFIAGKRSSFRSFPNRIVELQQGTAEATDFARIESISAFTALDKVREIPVRGATVFEICVHLLPDADPGIIVSWFDGYAKKLGFTVHDSLSFQAGNLWFVPVSGPQKAIAQLSQFAFVRVVRPVPKMRGLRPLVRSSEVSVPAVLPTEQPLSSLPKVAILDGGLPRQHPLGPWINSYVRLDPSAHDQLGGVDHGLAVTSSFLFGPIQSGKVAARPFSYVDHLRVLDKESDKEDPLELYRTLVFVEQVLLSRQYEFINLSLGPDLPIEDSDVHAWTSVIDDLLSDGDTFVTVAVGNNGDNDRASGNARIQVPSDCVNAVAVGAANNIGPSWSRASYSAFGPGRSPGVVKPDLMAFGGDANNYFHVVAPGKAPTLAPQLGTSFAAPYLLRNAVGIRAVLGSDLSVLAIKALLIHGANSNGEDKLEVGWGKTSEDFFDIITCAPGVARIVYQGELKPRKFLRAPIPIPKGGLTGRIRIKATFCYASQVDPQDASSYTRAGLSVVFRPDECRVADGAKCAKTKSFFKAQPYATEEERRSDLGKWETVLHAEEGMLGKSLSSPAFDIHYSTREGGAPTTSKDKIKYALVITVVALKHQNLFADILKSYANVLVPIQPQVSLPIRV